MTSKINRRRFLQHALVASGGMLTLAGLDPLGQLAQAQLNPEVPDRYYIFAYFRGGWDILLSLDPRDPQLFNEGNIRQTLIQPGYQLLPNGYQQRIEAGGITFGPYIGDLAIHADKLTVIRGMSMDTLTHAVGMRRFLTGKPPSGLIARGSSGSTWLASHMGQAQPIPNLSVQVEGYNKGLPNFASALGVNSSADLLRALRPTEPVFPRRLAQQQNELLTNAATCPKAQASGFWKTTEATRQKAIEMVNRGLDALFDFQARTPQMNRLRDHYGIRGTDSTPEVQTALAAQAITGGVSRCVSIQLADRSLDTHFDNWSRDQGPIQQRGFNAIARLIEDLAGREYGDGESWLDRTTIIGFSEFCRTAMLNERGGRDHSLTNACFLAGGSVRGGQVIGVSSDVGMAPVHIDLQTNEPSPDGTIIRPEHVLRSLFDEVGIDNSPDLRVTGLPTLLKP